MTPEEGPPDKWLWETPDAFLAWFEKQRPKAFRRYRDFMRKKHRTAEKPDEVQACNAVCPHLGCMVGYQESQTRFYCPCHQSAFQPDGKLIPPSAAARGLDSLEVRLEAGDAGGGQRVLVKFQNFRSGIPEKIAKS